MIYPGICPVKGRYEEMDQDELGIWTAPSGGRIAWFRDPAGNVLSISQL